MDDHEAWKKYPNHRKWFNKLYIADLFGYHCGPSGILPDHSGKYVVRPTYNLSGMGVGAKVVYHTPDNPICVPLGYFWCQYLHGSQYSVTYKFHGSWIPVSSFKGNNHDHALWEFTRWERIDYSPEFPEKIRGLEDVGLINVEFKDNSPFEVHLRDSPDPTYDIFIPIWLGQEHKIPLMEEQGYVFVSSYDDADGFLLTPRIGFMAKNR